MEPFNKSLQRQTTATSNTANTEPPADFTREKTSAHEFGRSIDQAKPDSHLRSEARNPKNGERSPWLIRLFSRVISIIKPQLKNQQPPVLTMCASDFIKALENNQFSGFRGQVMVADDLDLQDFGENTELPKRLYVQGTLNLTGAKIKRFPTKLYVGGELKINDCLHFPSGCQRLDVSKDLDLSGNPHIKELPEQVHVPGSLILNHCKNLKTLGKKLYVGKDLLVRHCNQLKKIPQDIKVAGNLEFTKCVRLSNIPDTIFQRPAGQSTDNERYIYFYGTGIALKNTSQDIADRENTVVHWNKNQTKTIKFLLYWTEKSKSFEKPPNLNLTPSEDEQLYSWLNKILETKDSHVDRESFIKRILDILHQIANDSEFKTYFFDTVYYSMTTCSDRVTLGLADLELKIFLFEANKLSQNKSPASEMKLREMGAQMLRLELLERYVQTKFIGRDSRSDPIEDMLFFKIYFKNRIGLPIKVDHIMFEGHSKVGHRDVIAAESYVKKWSTSENLSTFLKDWEPWQRYHELGRFYRPKYDDLTQCPPPDIKHRKCPITMESKGNMVYAEGQSYNFEALLEWVSKKPTLPHNPDKTIDWKNIQRWHSDDNLTDDDEATKL